MKLSLSTAELAVIMTACVLTGAFVMLLMSGVLAGDSGLALTGFAFGAAGMILLVVSMLVTIRSRRGS